MRTLRGEDGMEICKTCGLKKRRRKPHIDLWWRTQVHTPPIKRHTFTPTYTRTPATSPHHMNTGAPNSRETQPHTHARMHGRDDTRFHFFWGKEERRGGTKGTQDRERGPAPFSGLLRAQRRPSAMQQCDASRRDESGLKEGGEGQRRTEAAYPAPSPISMPEIHTRTHRWGKGGGEAQKKRCRGGNASSASVCLVGPRRKKREQQKYLPRPPHLLLFSSSLLSTCLHSHTFEGHSIRTRMSPARSWARRASLLLRSFE